MPGTNIWLRNFTYQYRQILHFSKHCLVLPLFSTVVLNSLRGSEGKLDPHTWTPVVGVLLLALGALLVLQLIRRKRREHGALWLPPWVHSQAPDSASFLPTSTLLKCLVRP